MSGNFLAVETAQIICTKWIKCFTLVSKCSLILLWKRTHWEFFHFLSIRTKCQQIFGVLLDIFQIAMRLPITTLHESRGWGLSKHSPLNSTIKTPPNHLNWTRFHSTLKLKFKKDPVPNLTWKINFNTLSNASYISLNRKNMTWQKWSQTCIAIRFAANICCMIKVDWTELKLMNHTVV